MVTLTSVIFTLNLLCTRVMIALGCRNHSRHAGSATSCHTTPSDNFVSADTGHTSLMLNPSCVSSRATWSGAPQGYEPGEARRWRLASAAGCRGGESTGGAPMGSPRPSRARGRVWDQSTATTHGRASTRRGRCPGRGGRCLKQRAIAAEVDETTQLGMLPLCTDLVSPISLKVGSP